MSFSDRMRVLKLLVTDEAKLEKVRIDEYFPINFYKQSLV